MRAMILCAGYGTRLGELTRDVPKPMLQLCGHPILEYIIIQLARHGFDQLAINLHHRPELIRDYFKDGSRWNVSITYSYEENLLGTAGGVKKMSKFFNQEKDFLIHYGDILTDQDFISMLHSHKEKKALVTLLLHQRAVSNSIVNMDSDCRIINFLERPNEEVRLREKSLWVNSGICMCSSEILNQIPEKLQCDLPRNIFTKLVPGGRLYGYPLSGYRCAIDSAERLQEAMSALEEGRCRIPLTRVCREIHGCHREEAGGRRGDF